MPITVKQLRAQYAMNATQLEAMVEEARIPTAEGAGGEDGKRYRGYYFHQLVAMAADRRASAEAPDAELEPMLRALNGMYAR